MVRYLYMAEIKKNGRPPKFKTLLEMQVVIDDYFKDCDPHMVEEDYFDHPYLLNEKGDIVRKTSGRPVRDYTAEPELQKRWVRTEQQPYTMAGMARHLGLSRQALMEYSHIGKFGDAIKAARARIEEFNERLLLSGKYATGAIFNLKVNFHYKDHEEENPPPENPIVFINTIPTSADDAEQD